MRDKAVTMCGKQSIHAHGLVLCSLFSFPDSCSTVNIPEDNPRKKEKNLASTPWENF